ncbi:hypothetical protein F5884DRAFT_811158 [Xylogone sp. PMI_703]|nr:hypothetical protein F5884DRAFT_811158 [Xylogone sp. PMI_703]
MAPSTRSRVESPQKRNKKTPEHTLTRVRNNQRRHRERRRQYIASLEERLCEAEHLLAEARCTISALQVQLDSSSNSMSVAPREAQVVTEHPHNKTGDISEISNNHAHNECPWAVPSTSNSAVVASSRRQPSTSISISPLSSSLPLYTHQPSIYESPKPSSCCCNRPKETDASLALVDSTAATTTTTLILPPEYNSLDLPPSTSDSESTTLCAEAYILVSQLNHRGLDAEAITCWLEEGFRRGRTKEEGCRVETRILFGLLDFISGI